MSLHRVLGTAGHIDHGKTSLVKALTGIDTDRLKEEQARGITIELGFAHLRLPSGATVGVVDVPGHERFIRTMVAGAVGIDAVLLVVAADEGVMPQTREHLDICALLGLRAGVVALTKSDLCEPELRELATLELRETLRGTFLQGAPIVACSARTGEGLPALVAAIAAVLAAAPGRDEGGLLRLPVDRVFSLHGFGTVATGTLWSGQLRVGDELVPLPGAATERLPPAKVRGLHVHGAAVNLAVAGQRTAVNLTLPLTALGRGETLVRPGTLQAGVLLDVQVQLLAVARAPLGRRSQLLLHAGTTQRLAQVTLLDESVLLPGGSAWAQLQVDAPLCAQPGDRFVLRGFAAQKNHGTTVGGGVVLRVLGVRHRRGSAELGERLAQITKALGQLTAKGTAAAQTLLLLELWRRGPSGATLAALRIAVPVAHEVLLDALRAELRAATVVELGAAAAGEGSEPATPSSPEATIYVSRRTFDYVGEEILRTLAAHHKNTPRSEGLPREALRLQLGPLGPAKTSSKKNVVAAAEPVATEGQAAAGKTQTAAAKAQTAAGKTQTAAAKAQAAAGKAQTAAGKAQTAAAKAQTPATKTQTPAAPGQTPAGQGQTPAAQGQAVLVAGSRSRDRAGAGEGPRTLCPPRLLAVVVDSLASAGRLVVQRELLRLPTHRVVSGDSERALAERVAAAYLSAALGPPRLEELPALLAALSAARGPRSPAAPPAAAVPAAALKVAVESLVRAGTLLRIKDLLFHHQPLAELRARLIAFLQEHRELTPPQWKDLVGQSRKFAIPLAEHFDAEKLTLRVGDLRRLRLVPGAPA